MIEKGQEWGWPGSLTDPSLIFENDRALGSHVALARTASAVRAVSGGDLARTLGISPSHDPTRSNHVVPVDALRIVIDDQTEHIAVAHTVVGYPVRERGCIAIMNAAFIGNLNIAPRAHPGDGKADVVQFSLSLGDRIKAYRRMPLGTHVPHPGIATKRLSAGSFDFPRARAVRVDGHRVGRAKRLTFEVLPAQMELAV